MMRFISCSTVQVSGSAPQGSPVSMQSKIPRMCQPLRGCMHESESQFIPQFNLQCIPKHFLLLHFSNMDLIYKFIVICSKESGHSTLDFTLGTIPVNLNGSFWLFSLVSLTVLSSVDVYLVYHHINQHLQHLW